ncbi:exodeoxyribonuclease III [Agaricicola taiwanensis]|uniref:Exodeoxyribonuclease III n=1 Tax=Agaricicola taiwanensis TaxID=591372 RepID=A0A8J2VME4_9RHOB|nr:exodeoxyribonuclease III [Agaricicola taiwanensis]GGE28718.1 exodeoxyribonuclease III [Agaricicola taiwanensis]
MPLRLTTWNINSVRLRIDLVRRYIADHAPDVLCLQETKCINDLFPLGAFHDLGYRHCVVHGQKGYHGVATISRIPLERVESMILGGEDHARHAGARLMEGPFAGTVIHNFYVPAGGDIPDPALNAKFAHKLAYLDDMTLWGGNRLRQKEIMVGDLNVAPLPNDVWDHKKMLKIVSHTPVEVEKLTEAQSAGGWVDVMRQLVPDSEKLFTWWSYRAADWLASNRGRRLDHIWVTPDMAPGITKLDVLKDARGWDRPSDHVPVMAVLG